MNKIRSDVLNTLLSIPCCNQRALAKASGYSLGAVNQAVRWLTENGYLDKDLHPTQTAVQYAESNRPKRAVILAAGNGVRMAPINLDMPKAFLEVNEETLIERLLKQLHEVGIHEIYIVVGFMKEAFDYLIDEYGVKLIVNSDYAVKNNLHSVKLAQAYLENCYVLPCDLWCADNPFRPYEFYSWYMVSDALVADSKVRINRQMELMMSDGGNAMLGIAYLTAQDAADVRQTVIQQCQQHRYDGSFWESALYGKDRMRLLGRLVSENQVVEINTYEQLRSLDGHSKQLRHASLEWAANILDADCADIAEVTAMKKGVTNRSFRFSCKDKRYIMRIPDSRTQSIVDRAKEAAVYAAINDLHISDRVLYIDPATGYKLAEYLDGARPCNPMDDADVKLCMAHLKAFHAMHLQVPHEMNPFRQVQLYEDLWENAPSGYRDYQATKDKVFSLQDFIQAHAGEKCLTHVDPIPENFLIIDGADADHAVRLIDWEYAAMQDPHLDLAMFCISALYSREQVDHLIDIYFENACPRVTRIKIYCYISVCGLLWSNWCEYKRRLGVEFGEYSMRQYRFAKDYYALAKEEMNHLGDEV